MNTDDFKDTQNYTRNIGKSKKRRSSSKSNSKCSNVECVVCMDYFAEQVSCGVCCPDGHFLCAPDLVSVSFHRDLIPTDLF